MNTIIGQLLAQAITSAIVTAFIVVVAFAITSRWPPQEWLICSSIGGALSPVVWRAYRAVRPHPSEPTQGQVSEPS